MGHNMEECAGNAGGVIEGDVRINGHPKQQETFSRVSGYCEQTDVHVSQPWPKGTVLDPYPYPLTLNPSHGGTNPGGHCQLQQLLPIFLQFDPLSVNSYLRFFLLHGSSSGCSNQKG